MSVFFDKQAVRDVLRRIVRYDKWLNESILLIW